jgi:hypothetical protein
MPAPREWHEAAARALAREQNRTVDELGETVSRAPVEGSTPTGTVVRGDSKHQPSRGENATDVLPIDEVGNHLP